MAELNPKEQPLLEGIRKRDTESLSEFVKTNLPKIFQLSFRLCKNSNEAEDLTQDVFVKAIQSIQTFRGESALSTWLYRITINTWKNKIRWAMTHTKKESSLSANGDGEKSSLEENLKENNPTPEKMAEKKETQSRVQIALSELSSDDQLIISLKDIEDKSYDDISTILEINLGTVKSRLSRARERLREKLILMGEILR